jgi:putative holliday junction resolvase
MGRILAVDFGHVRMGIALTDPLNIFASPLPLIKGSKDPLKAAENLATAFKEICSTKKIEIELVVIGLPLHLDGRESDRSKEVRAFADRLKELIPAKIQLFDERMTTLQAERSLIEANVSRKKRTRTIDGVSSTILLQSFLDFQQRQVP